MLPALDSFELPRFDGLPGPERFDRLTDLVGEADREGVLGHPPGQTVAAAGQETVPSRIRILRTRLFLLGYLGRDNGRSRSDRPFRDALADFREEAGLAADRDQTWNALQELVSFETPPDLERWLVNCTPSPPLRRAVETRLHVLGLMSSRHPRKPEKVTAALEDFVLVAELLELAPSPLPAEMSRATLRVLFDQDATAKRLGDSEQAIATRRPQRVSQRRARNLMRRFIVANAKVELWLTGYDLPLAGKTKFEVPPTRQYLRAQFPVFHGLYSFWRDTGQSETQARESASSITGALFRQLDAMAEQAARTTDTVAAEKLYSQVASARIDDRTAIWDQVKAIGSRIWDGVKRAWRWLKSLIARGARKAAAWIKNMARLTFRFASNAFKVVKRAVKNAARAIDFMLDKTVPGSDPEHLVIQRDGDFDYRLALNRNYDPARVDALLDDFRLQATRFNIAVRILGALIGGLIKVVRKGALGGWFGFVMALVRMHSQRGVVSQLLQLGREQEALT